MDNSLDSGADNIEVRIDGGGIRSILVKDNGSGMSKEDLAICCLPHATSKIVTEEDLHRILSLGFRGEALAAIAACTVLTITTAQAEDPTGYRLKIVEGRDQDLAVFPAKPGTSVLCEDLFYSIPARRNFLKSPGSEGALCRKMVEEKALAFPAVAISFYSDGQLKFNLPQQTLTQRLLAIYGSGLQEFQLKPFDFRHRQFKLFGLISLPQLSRTDRKEIHIYANKRKIQEFSLVQAVSYALEDYLPGGVYPYAWVFLEVDPALVDFNIHPAKKEARFRNLPDIHKHLVETLKQALADQKIRASGTTSVESPGLFTTPPASYSRPQDFPSVRADSAAESNFYQAYQKAIQTAPVEPSAVTPAQFRYLGQVLNLFLVVEMGDCFYLIDQHAAHERVLYEDYLAGRQNLQPLLVPLEFDLEPDEAAVLTSLLERYGQLGIGLLPISAVRFSLIHIPQACAFLEPEIIQFIRNMKGIPEDLERDLYASMACRAAIMDGDAIDRGTAIDLITKAFRLDNARCPHGRPVWLKFSRKELYERFGRLI